MIWENKIPDKEGILLRQCAAKNYHQIHNIVRWEFKDGTSQLKTTWDGGVIILSDPTMRHKLEAFYWYGPIELPPESNLSLVIKEN